MAVNTIAGNTAALMVSLENRKQANHQRRLEYYGLLESSNINFSDSLKIKKMENQQRRLAYYGLQYLEWMVSCKAQNERMRCQYYGLGDNETPSGLTALDSSKLVEPTGAVFDFDKLCKELEDFMMTNWAMEMEKESVQQWKSEKVQKKNT